MLAKHHLPALAAVVVRSDSLDAAALGVRRVGQSDAVTLEDYFHIGSNTKSMTATLAGALVEDGALSWDLTLADAFPEMKIHPGYAGVTLRQLLSHTAGLSPMTDDAEFVPVPELTGSPTEQRRAFVAWLLEREPAFPKAQEFHYSNAGYSVAAHLIETRTGRPWEELMRQRVFAPLHIHMVFGWPTVAGPAQPVGHVQGTNGLELQDPAYQLGPALAPAGDVSLPIRDYGRYLQAHLRGLRGRPGLLRPETFQVLHEPVSRNEKGVGYALGWGIAELDGVPTHVHTGSAGTFVACVALQPSRDLAVALMTNAGGDEVEPGAKEAMRELIKRFSR
jgi:CubicO group peptidase (beta-lactamase class C family)